MMRLKMRAVVLSIVAVLLVFSFAPNSSFAICMKKGDVAPEFVLSDIDGNIVKLSDYRGKVVLLTFWATWCAKCWEEIDFIQTSLEKTEDLAIILINMETRSLSEAHLKKIKTTVRELDIKFPVLLDLKLKAYKDYCISSLPSTAIVDREGIIQFAGPHFYKAYREKINNVIKELSAK